MQNKAIRRSFYFSQKNLDLLNFLESREDLSANEFLIEILRAAQSNTHPSSATSTSDEDMTNNELYHKLEHLISNLQVVQSTQIAVDSTKSEEYEEVNTSKKNSDIPVLSQQTITDMENFF